MFDIIGPHNHWTISRLQIHILIILIIWETIWKFVACWKAARNNQLAWFVVMAIINTAGILEIIYILFFQKKHPKKQSK
jgi:hypothetical protein